MKLLHRWRIIASLLSVAFVLGSVAAPLPTLAATTGTIQGTVTDAQTGAPIADAKVSAAAPSGGQSTTTDQHGFYVLQALTPDTYTLSVQATGYTAESIPGVVVQQDLTTTQNARLNKEIKTIANVHARSAGNLVQPNTTTDVYNVSGAQLNAISGGNDLHKTLYQYVAAIPGVTGSGFPAQPRIHGGSAADIAYEFDGIPINERITGLFTTNLSNVGMGNVEVFTGGLGASQSASGLGIINTVVKTGTYPGQLQVSYGTTFENSNQFETLEYGGATPNHRYSWFMSVDNTNSLNQWSSGQTYPAQLIEQANGPGTVKTLDLIGNFHYRPNSKDDFQFLIQNGLGEFNFSYLMPRAPGEPVPLTAMPCNGAQPDPTELNWSGGVGGVAPNGQTCPLGLYFGTANTNQGGGNIWHHYSGLGKIQWSHIVDDHSYFQFKLAENFNQYVFDQPVIEANMPLYENSPDFSISGNTYVPDGKGGYTKVTVPCPALPYQAGTPIQSVPVWSIDKKTGQPVQTGTKACDQFYNWFSTGYWQNRESHMYLGSIDYSNTLNANTTVKVGVGDEFDKNQVEVFYTPFFNMDGTWPAKNFDSDYPTTLAYAYASADIRAGKWLFSPGVRFSHENYLTPVKHFGVSLVNPTFSFNYTINPTNVIRGSATDSTSFVGSEYVYRNIPAGFLNGFSPTTAYCAPGTQSTSNCSFSPDPTLAHSYDLQWEHDFDANTSIKFGPYFWKESNIYETYTPYTCTPPTSPGGLPSCTKSGPSIPYNGGIRQAFGFELGLNHVDNNPVGVSYWLSATYDNFWASSTSSLTTPWGTVPLPPSAVARGNLLRSSADPPFVGTLTADWHIYGLHFMPLYYYQSPVTYYTGTISSTTHGTVTAIPNHSFGWASLNGTIAYEMNNGITIGLQGQNILNNDRGVTPCRVSILGSSPNLGIGCSGMWPAGAGTVQTGLNSITAGQYEYPSSAQSTPLWMLFISKKI
jgi:hypothetical protein